jgi:hypothetical protein
MQGKVEHGLHFDKALVAVGFAMHGDLAGIFFPVILTKYTL